jgi:hypothetical protein
MGPQKHIQRVADIHAHQVGRLHGSDGRPLPLDKTNAKGGLSQNQTIVFAVPNGQQSFQTKAFAMDEFSPILPVSPDNFQGAGHPFQLDARAVVGVGRDDVNSDQGSQLRQFFSDTRNQLAVDGDGAVEIEQDMLDGYFALLGNVESNHKQLFSL